ncbi:diaminopropionate ammonia-lyase [Nakamurella silvestris]|nr:diaminopropionate ammonia-lyase [Nakamurella silvestris]
MSEPADPQDHWYFRHEARTWAAAAQSRSARPFHRALPGYQPTPLVSLPGIAAECGVAAVLAKDESARMALPAFKILGASWAVFRAVNRYLGRDDTDVDLAGLRAAIPVDQELTLVTASDGNHGRAVARMAALLGIRARVHLPDGVTPEAVTAIRAEGAAVVEGPGIYDEMVRRAAASTVGVSTELLVQDTSWPGYEEVPGWIVQGYHTLFQEIDSQVADLGIGGVDLVAVPTGVGSLLQAAADHYRGASALRPRLLSVEPTSAACVAASLLADRPVTVDTARPTVMAGLNCGSVSALGWPSIRGGIDAAVGVSDAQAIDALRDLNDGAGLTVGPCGASALAGVRAALSRQDRRDQLGLTADAVVVLVSTEGFDANPHLTNGPDL